MITDEKDRNLELAIALLSRVGKLMGWQIGIPPGPKTMQVDGIVMGTQKFMEQTIVDSEDWDILVQDGQGKGIGNDQLN